MTNWKINHPAETQLIPDWIIDIGYQKCFVYRGNSMLSTFRPGQLLYVRETIETIRPGNVVVFRMSPDSEFTVHRVVGRKGSSWILRGDNNSRQDVLPVLREQIVGIVGLVESHNRVKAVQGGKPALWKARIRWGFRAVKKRIPGFVKSVYSNIRKSKMVYRIMVQNLNRHLRIIRINTPSGVLIKVTHRGRTVARWFEGHTDIYCRKPFDLIIKKMRKSEDIS